MTPEQMNLKEAAEIVALGWYDGNFSDVQARFDELVTASAILSLIAQVEALTVPQWISVDTALPELGQQVIAYRPTALASQDAPIRLVRYTGSIRESWQGVAHGFDCICHPTHWMALPAAPTIPAIPRTKEGE